ncbi:hypothetical protein BTJ68_11960 [Hortaea werneckii EXF-2000]|uniref:Protein kinase domain-containing protein n=1 Tax=Hortaea werneckii EXF-2000 TaxID=1157616 RepID=A0A1Z5STL2_HORWE|nr:hypothetical protein BTJ68_11960 [Hortaea werneckii EXF-2000]
MASTIRVGRTVKGSKGIYTITRKLHDHVWVASHLTSLSTKHTRSCAAHDNVVLKCASQKRLQREKRVLQMFKGHACIRQLIDYAGDPHCLVLEHLYEDALRSASKAPISRLNVKTIARNVLSALESLHANGIVHTDIKPDNMLLNYYH